MKNTFISKAASILAAISLSLMASSTVYAEHKDRDAKKAKSLPPGLQKKVRNGGELPPGWQKKLAVGDVLDKRIYRDSDILRREDGEVVLRREDQIIRVLENSREILDILNL